ncbi:MAG: pyridoxal phosphate-dependent aminotransferase [Boseongicola sp.]|nr:pyridoxal phosphate-dependent aminotransferase [Boseongicola sp.]
MDFDFDTQLELRGTHCSKYDGIEKMFGVDGEGVIPMWVADMDFPAAPAIRAALQVELDRGYFGYFTNPTPVSQSVADWYQRRHGWSFDPEAVRYTHGVISGYADVLAAYSEPGDAVITFSPVYHAFFRKLRAMGRTALQCPLVERDGIFHMDLDMLSGMLTGNEKIMTLCSPHNPGGRIWSADELKAVADFCAAHDLILISDEIHMDLCFPGAKFTPIGIAAPEHMDRTVVLNAASKAFNIAGGETGLAIIPDEKMRRKLDAVMMDRESSPNRFAMMMIKAAFTECDDWIDAAREYLAENFRIFAERMSALPGVRVMDMQSTYLSWVDFTDLGMSDAELIKRLVTEAKVAPSPGTQFELGGTGHMRFNLALPRPTLLEAISRIERAFSDLQ